jgi:hypothetical protein
MWATASTKQVQERKRDIDKEAKAPGSTVPSAALAAIELSTDVRGLRKGFLSDLYSDRNGGRRLWQAGLATLVLNGKVRETLGTGGGAVSFSGVGSVEEERRRTVTLGANDAPPQFSAPSGQREDTELERQATQTMRNGKNTLLVGDDIDHLCIGTLAADKQQQLLLLSREERTLGKIFVRMKSQQVPLGDGGDSGSFEEQYWCCDDLANEIKALPELSKQRAGTAEEEPEPVVALEQRVPSVIALMILLGGDTTSYLYHPYTRSLAVYLAHAEFVGALTRPPTAQEEAEGWPLAVDKEAATRLFKLLYACRNPGAIDRWTSLPLSERSTALRGMSYFDLEQKVARCVFPLTMRFMPKWTLLVQHILRAQHRLRTWYNADLSAPLDVRLLGFVVVMKPPATAMVDGGVERLEAPTEAAVAARCADGWVVDRVEPNIAPVNTTLTEYFGPVFPADVLLRGAKARAPRSAEGASAEKLARAPLLASARARMKPTSLLKPRMDHMVAVAVAFKAYEGGSVRELTALRKSMKGSGNASLVFNNLVLSRKGKSFPWTEMGAPEDSAAEGVVSEGEDEDDAEAGADADVVSDEDEDAAAEVDEDLALGELFESVVAAVGTEAEELVDEIDDAASDADARAVAEARMEAHLGRRARALPERYR